MSHDAIETTFDAWAAAGRDVGMEQGHGDVVQQCVDQLEIGFGHQILDLGCGNGWATRLLAKSVAGSGAVGVDASKAMIARAEELHSYTIRARYEQARFEELPFKDGHFDRAFSMEALYYAVDLTKSLAELQRVLKPGGRADILIDYYTGRPGVAGWSKGVGLAMQDLTPGGWVAALGTAGFGPVTTVRLIDSRGAGEQAAFQPSDDYPDFATLQGYKGAGTLWMQAERA